MKRLTRKQAIKELAIDALASLGAALLIALIAAALFATLLALSEP